MRFIDDKIEVICKELKLRKDITVKRLWDFEYQPCGYKAGNEPPADGWVPFEKDTRVGGKDAHWWFHIKFTTPAASDLARRELYFQFFTGCEDGWDAANPQCIAYLNGAMVQGLDINHSEILLDYATEYDMYLYLYSSMRDNLFDFKAVLKEIDLPTERAFYDLSVPLEAALLFDEESELYISSLRYLENAVNLLDLRMPYSKEYYDGIEAACGYLHDEFYNGFCGKSEAIVHCVGHTHIDVAWLWTLAQTKEKTQRSFATVLNLMKQFPEYTFMASQPQLYVYLKEEAPKLYEQVKQAVRDGRWEVEGGAWLEMDTNLPSGESLVRQFLYGKRFMQEEFGVDSRALWLPDVFGYSGALPQILRKSGVDTFVTSKLAWSEINKMPYDAFYWEGIDGSRVFTHFITTQNRPLAPNKARKHACTYNAMLNPGQVLGTWERFQQKAYSNLSLMTFGFGDGGGGPTKHMLMQQRRLAYGLPGLPKTRIGFVMPMLDQARESFDKNAAEMRRTPTWVGELYLEYHRGTYTSIAKNKKNNRKSELELGKAENLGVISMLSGGGYDKERLDECWRTVLLNQFHDIIPGSSIFEVYEDSDRQYAQVLGSAAAMSYSGCLEIEGKIATDGGLLVYNMTPFMQSGTVSCGGKSVFVADIPAHGYKVVRPQDFNGSVKLYKNGIENDFFSLMIDDCGDIVSLYDKRCGREVVKEGAKMRLVAYEDFPRAYDAWEISSYYKTKFWELDGSAKVTGVTDGARSGIVIERRFLESVIKQTVWMYENIERIDVENEIDWQQEHIILKADFPVDVHTEKATYEIQFGSLQRPTHSNTSWDEAKFEVCAHKWADIGDDGYGFSLLNDCKYGHSAEGSTLSLTMLKCATHPNPQADKGLHRFTYSLLPHEGSFREAGTIQQAWLVNQPLFGADIGAQDGSLADCYSVVSTKTPGIVVETVKRAEDSGDVVVRLYEAFDRRSRALLEVGFDFDGAFVCDNLENELEQLESDGRCVSLSVKNFEIVTLKFTNPRL